MNTKMSVPAKAKAQHRRWQAAQLKVCPARLSAEKAQHGQTKAAFDRYRAQIAKVFNIEVVRLQPHRLLGIQIRIEDELLQSYCNLPEFCLYLAQQLTAEMVTYKEGKK